MANLNQARNSALSSISRLGQISSEFEISSDPVVEACGEFIKRVTKNIDDEDLVDTGAMVSSLSVDIIDSGKSYEIKGLKYLLYLDEGMRGSLDSSLAPNSPYIMTKIPHSSLFVDWINRKKIPVTGTVEQAAYAMAKHRYEYGYAPKNILSKEIPKLAEDLGNNIANSIANQLITLK